MCRCEGECVGVGVHVQVWVCAGVRVCMYEASIAQPFLLVHPPPAPVSSMTPPTSLLPVQAPPTGPSHSPTSSVGWSPSWSVQEWSSPGCATLYREDQKVRLLLKFLLKFPSRFRNRYRRNGFNCDNLILANGEFALNTQNQNAIMRYTMQ